MPQITSQYQFPKPIVYPTSHVIKENALSHASGDQFRFSTSKVASVHFSGTPNEYTTFFGWWENQRKNSDYVLYKDNRLGLAHYTLTYTVGKLSELPGDLNEKYIKKASAWSCGDAVQVYKQIEGTRLSKSNAKKYLQEEQSNGHFTSLSIETKTGKQKESGSNSESEDSGAETDKSSVPAVKTNVDVHKNKNADDFVRWLLGFSQKRKTAHVPTLDGLIASYCISRDKVASNLSRANPVFSEPEIQEIKRQINDYNKKVSNENRIRYIS
jgi:hypothetical protein